MRAVLDVNVALKIVLPEADSPLAVSLIADYAAGLHEFLAPDFFVLEAAHVLTKAGRRGIIFDPRRTLARVMLNAPAMHPFRPLLSRSIEISIQTGHAVYDCLYVALAEREGCVVITADQRMISNLQATFPFIVHLSTV